MAKRSDSVSIGEKLEKVLIPACEQPHKVPENWIWTTVGNLNNYVGSSVDPTKTPNEIYELYSVPSSANNYPEILAGVEIGSTKQLVRKEDVLLCKINPRINRVWKVYKHTKNLIVASSEWIVIRNSRINSDYLMWFFRTEFFRKYMLSNVSGVGGSLMRAQPKYVQTYPVPLPPFAEQNRIVVRIESLFSKLDEAKEKVQKAIDSFEIRKAAILHKAFTGELSKKWREENGVSIDNWKEKTLASVCYSIFDGDHMPPPKSESGVPFLVISNVNNGMLSFENTRFVPQEYYDRLTETRKPMLNDVLYTIVGSIGIPVLVNSSREFCFQRHIALFKPRNINSKFLWYLLQSEDAFQKSNNIATGTAQRTVPIKGLRGLSFAIPMLPSEQNEIVRILDSIFDKEQQAKELASVLEKINLIKKAILARAFRGELDTNISKEESALELLKEILSAN
ncbi:MAG: restriction endonuclease subunit S [Acetobacterium woodii]|nr:restriction endonuclease subunit S [Acetobacterium woodii]